MCADFSHLSKITPDMVVRCSRLDNSEVTDDMFLDALANINPPLLEEPYATALNHILQGRRGRPKKGQPSRTDLQQAIASIDRPDIPDEFPQVLSKRLDRSRRFTEAERSIRARRKINSLEKTDLIYGLYRDFYALLEADGEFLEHPILGTLPIAKGEKTRSDRAAYLTRYVLREYFGYDPPSSRRILNIFTERRKLMAKIKRSPKT